MNTQPRDYSAPAQTEFDGREFSAEITFRLKEDATDDEIAEWLEYELGGGSIASAHPLVKSGAYIRRVEVNRLRRTNRLHYTDMGPTDKNGSASGTTRVEYDRAGA